MKKEDLQSSQEGTASAEDKQESREQQKNQSNVSHNQQKNKTLQAGLGRDRMIDIEDLGGMSGRDDAGGDRH